MRYAPEEVKAKMLNLKQAELEHLATQAGNHTAFVALTVQEDYQQTARLLGVENTFEEYLTKVKDDSGRLHPMSLHFIQEYRLFLMAKICFPEETQ